jgi:cation transport ATPase
VETQEAEGKAKAVAKAKKAKRKKLKKKKKKEKEEAKKNKKKKKKKKGESESEESDEDEDEDEEESEDEDEDEDEDEEDGEEDEEDEEDEDEEEEEEPEEESEPEPEPQTIVELTPVLRGLLADWVNALLEVVCSPRRLSRDSSEEWAMALADSEVLAYVLDAVVPTAAGSPDVLQLHRQAGTAARKTGAVKEAACAAAVCGRLRELEKSEPLWASRLPLRPEHISPPSSAHLAYTLASLFDCSDGAPRGRRSPVLPRFGGLH